MTLQIKETGIRHVCTHCRKKTIAEEHNGTMISKRGKDIVIGESFTISCPGCGRLNHLSIQSKTDDVT